MRCHQAARATRLFGTMGHWRQVSRRSWSLGPSKLGEGLHKYQRTLGRTSHQAPQAIEPRRVVQVSRIHERMTGIPEGAAGPLLGPFCLPCLGFPTALGTAALPPLS